MTLLPATSIKISRKSFFDISRQRLDNVFGCPKPSPLLNKFYDTEHCSPMCDYTTQGDTATRTSTSARRTPIFATTAGRALTRSAPTSVCACWAGRGLIARLTWTTAWTTRAARAASASTRSAPFTASVGMAPSVSPSSVVGV